MCGSAVGWERLTPGQSTNRVASDLRTQQVFRPKPRRGVNRLGPVTYLAGKSYKNRPISSNSEPCAWSDADDGAGGSGSTEPSRTFGLKTILHHQDVRATRDPLRGEGGETSWSGLQPIDGAPVLTTAQRVLLQKHPCCRCLPPRLEQSCHFDQQMSASP